MKAVKRLFVKVSKGFSTSGVRLAIDINRSLFQTAFVLYLFLFIFETLKPGFVSDFFSLSIIIWIVLVSGVLFIFTTALKPQNIESAVDRRVKKRPVAYIAAIAAFFTFMLLLLGAPLGRAAYLLYVGLGISMFILLEGFFSGRLTESRENVMENHDEKTAVNPNAS